MKSDVLFLWGDIDNEFVLDKLVIKQEIDTVKYVTGAILLVGSGMIKIVGTNLYKKITIRNINTTRKIYKLMQAAQK